MMISAKADKTDFSIVEEGSSTDAEYGNIQDAKTVYAAIAEVKKK